MDDTGKKHCYSAFLIIALLLIMGLHPAHVTQIDEMLWNVPVGKGLLTANIFLFVVFARFGLHYILSAVMLVLMGCYIRATYQECSHHDIRHYIIMGILLCLTAFSMTNVNEAINMYMSV